MRCVIADLLATAYTDTIGHGSTVTASSGATRALPNSKKDRLVNPPFSVNSSSLTSARLSAAVSCFVLERACGHALAGRVAREADLNTKLKLGSQPYEHLRRADSLRTYVIYNAFIRPQRF